MRPAVLQNESRLITVARHKAPCLYFFFFLEDKISIYLLIDCISTQGLTKSMMVQKQGFPFTLHVGTRFPFIAMPLIWLDFIKTRLC